MPRTDFEKIKPLIIADWRTGEYSMPALVKKYNVSVGYVAKVTKGIDKDGAEAVKAGVVYNQALANPDENFVKAVKDVVHEKTRYLEIIEKQAMRNMQMAMMADCETQQDFNARAKTVQITKETVFGKDPSLQVNTQVNSAPVEHVVIRGVLPNDRNSR